jgi:hypothetical protein
LVWLNIDNSLAFLSDKLPIDLNNLFKYAVPRFWICDIGLLDGVIWSVKVSIPDIHGIGKHGNGKATDEKLELALFWAIYEVIKEK